MNGRRNNQRRAKRARESPKGKSTSQTSGNGNGNGNSNSNNDSNHALRGTSRGAGSASALASSRGKRSQSSSQNLNQGDKKSRLDQEKLPPVTENAVLQAISGTGPQVGLFRNHDGAKTKVEGQEDPGHDCSSRTGISGAPHDPIFRVRMRFSKSMTEVVIGPPPVKLTSGHDVGHTKHHFAVIMSDGKHCAKVQVWKTPALMEQIRNKHYEALDRNPTLAVKLRSDMSLVDYLVEVHGFVSTVGLNATKSRATSRPLVFLTSINIVGALPVSKNHRTVIGIPLKLPDDLTAYATTVDGSQRRGESSNGRPSSPPSAGRNSAQAPHKAPAFRVYGGTSGSFLKQHAPFLTNADLVGESAIASQVFAGDEANDSSRKEKNAGTSALSSDAPERIIADEKLGTKPFQDKVSTIKAFLAQHLTMTAMKNASKSSFRIDSGLAASTVNPSPSLSPTLDALEHYQSALDDFVVSQQDRQKASLTSNSGKEDATRSAVVTVNYAAALERSLTHDSALSSQVVCEWHGLLLKDLHPNAGVLRSNSVRAGGTVFAPPSRVKEELELVCRGLADMEKRLSLGIAPTGSDGGSRNVLHILLFCAIAMFSIVDIHPFSDGNGRLCRLVANWAMRRTAKLPFPFNLFANPEQRAGYISALEQTRHNLSMRCYGDAKQEDLVDAIRYSGAFRPLIHLLADRLGRTTEEFSRVYMEKVDCKKQEAEARAARIARERSAAGTCLICFEESPNIATLCCGRACHLNCIAEWLSGRNSCPVCRSELPALPPRMRSQAPAPANEADGAEVAFGGGVFVFSENDTTFDETSFYSSDESTSEQDADMLQIQQAVHRAGMMNAASGNEVVFDGSAFFSDTDSTSVTPTVHQLGNVAGAPIDVDRDTTEVMVDTLAQNGAVEYETTFETTDDTTTDDTTTEEVVPPVQNAAAEHETTDDTTDETTEDDALTTDDMSTTEEYASPPPRPQVKLCDSCNNHAAADCTNGLCGRCCVISGQYQCSRHGV